MLKPIYHGVCGKPAFLYDGKLDTVGEVPEATRARHLDGQPILPGERAICGSCGRPVQFHEASLRVEGERRRVAKERGWRES